jgi:hypothetical protein
MGRVNKVGEAAVYRNATAVSGIANVAGVESLHRIYDITRTDYSRSALFVEYEFASGRAVCMPPQAQPPDEHRTK